MSNNNLEGLEAALMAALCQEFRIRHGAGNDEPFDIERFLIDRFPNTPSRIELRQTLPRLADRGLIEMDEQTLRLTQNGIHHCNNNVRG